MASTCAVSTTRLRRDPVGLRPPPRADVRRSAVHARGASALQRALRPAPGLASHSARRRLPAAAASADRGEQHQGPDRGPELALRQQLPGCAAARRGDARARAATGRRRHRVRQHVPGLRIALPRPQARARRPARGAQRDPRLRQGVAETRGAPEHARKTSVDEGEKESLHPVVRVHPAPAERACSSIASTPSASRTGPPRRASRYCAYLYAQLDKPEYGCRIHWQPDTVVLWDNRFTQHRAIFDYVGQRRSLVRTTIQGERPA